METFSLALDEVISPQLGEAGKSKAEIAYEGQIEKINKMIEMQQKNLKS